MEITHSRAAANSKPSVCRLLALLLFCPLLTGCFDTKQEITLNPDGTGKVVIESTFTLSPGVGGFSSSATPSQGLTNHVRKILESAEGVEAWRDVSFRWQEDGRAYFRGIAFFSDLSKFKVEAMTGQGYSVTRDDAGNLNITLAASPPPESPIQRANQPVTSESLARDRATLRSAMPLLQSTLGTMKVDTTIRVPGTIKRSSNFEISTPNTLRRLSDGKEYIEALQDFLLNTNYDAARISGERIQFDDLMNEKLYGQRGPIMAVIKPGKTRWFDYHKEVASARRDFAPIAKALNLGDQVPSEPKPAAPGAPAKVSVTGIQWNYGNSSPVRNSFDENAPGYTLRLKADLPGTVLKLNRIEVLRATTIEGSNLLPKYAWRDMPTLMPGATTLTFRVRLNEPPIESKGLAEVSGFLECDSMSNRRTVKLISGRLKTGAKGAEFDTQIDGIDPRLSGKDRISLRTRLKPEQIRSIRILGDAGQTAYLQQRGHTTLNDEHVITYLSDHEIPPKGKIVAEVLTGEQTLKIPFALTNVNLLGQPLK
jgi:hypothetical protein